MKKFLFSYRQVPTNYSRNELMTIEADSRETAVKRFLELWIAPLPVWKCVEQDGITILP